MKKNKKKLVDKSKVKKLSGPQKEKAKKSLIAKGAVPSILHTDGAEMPDPSVRKGSSRKDAREAFR